MFATAKKFFHGEEEIQEERGLRLLETPSLSIALRTPQALEDIPDFAQCLMDGEAVILNLAELSDEDKVRALDYMDGVAYTLNAMADRVGTDIYLFTPEKVEIVKI